MLSNAHTHTTFCDGTRTPEEMVREALQNRFLCLGFSGHGYAPFDPACGMTPENTLAYRKEIERLREKYAGQIVLFTGLEQDFDAPWDNLIWDYRIGSVHYMKKNGAYAALDLSAGTLLSLIRDGYRGDVLRLVAEYCEKELKMAREKKPAIIGHFDLYRKYNDQCGYLDETDPKYLGMIKDTLTELCRMDVLFEVNIGAVNSGLCREPYPSVALLRILRDLHARLIITTDAHHEGTLAMGYEKARKLLLDLGFSSMTVLTPAGFAETGI